jgi:fibronectin type 3 domain-containing protein
VFAGDAVQLERTEPGLSQAQTSEKKKKGPTVKLSGSSSNGIVQLRIAASPDPGGATDQTAKAGAQYRYAVARVRQVMLNGHEYMLRGEASEVTSAILVDTFAPHVPVGLATVATPGPENNKGAIDLSWEPGTEVDAIGYNVYRSENGEPAVKITAQPIPGTSFHDEHVLAGRRYIYSITAIDRTGNESARSKPAEETMP